MKKKKAKKPAPATKRKPLKKKSGNFNFEFLKNIMQIPRTNVRKWGMYYITKWKMILFPRRDSSFAYTTKTQVAAICGAFLLGVGLAAFLPTNASQIEETQLEKEEVYWFDLHRKSQVELLYLGVPGDRTESILVRAFKVKTGMEGRPTPLPQLFGREYWIITKKYETPEIPETAPYFIELDVPHTEEYPFGPSPYHECGLEGKEQCNWELPGPFGLHGINTDVTRLDSVNLGSSGCIRHRDEDITYLYNLLDTTQEIRYYIQDI